LHTLQSSSAEETLNVNNSTHPHQHHQNTNRLAYTNPTQIDEKSKGKLQFITVFYLMIHLAKFKYFGKNYNKTRQKLWKKLKNKPI